MRTIIATSPIPTCCRSSSTTRSSQACRDSLPELPDAKRKRFEGAGHHALQRRGADRRGRDRALVRRACSTPARRRPQAANWVTSELFGALNRLRRDARRLARSARRRRRTAAPRRRRDAVGQPRQAGVRDHARNRRRAAQIVEERGLKQTSDTGAIDAEIDEILAANADKVEQYKAGKEALFGFFVGQTMKAMQGKANPQVINERLKAKLA